MLPRRPTRSGIGPSSVGRARERHKKTNRLPRFQLPAHLPYGGSQLQSGSSKRSSGIQIGSSLALPKTVGNHDSSTRQQFSAKFIQKQGFANIFEGYRFGKYFVYKTPLEGLGAVPCSCH